MGLGRALKIPRDKASEAASGSVDTKVRLLNSSQAEKMVRGQPLTITFQQIHLNLKMPGGSGEPRIWRAEIAKAFCVPEEGWSWQAL